MGCDIHAFVEYKDTDADRWQMIADMDLSRWYEWFGHLAGVRRAITPLVTPRGFPADGSFGVMAAIEEWEGDAHHTSWITLSEAKEIATRYTNYEFDAVIALMDSLERSGHETRFTFWFDN